MRDKIMAVDEHGALGLTVAYADQSERDFAALDAAARSGRVPVERGA